MTDENIRLIDYLKITLGISNIKEQVQLIKSFTDTNDGIERVKVFSKQKRHINTGVRIPVTNLDCKMVAIIRDVFSVLCDGIIAPKLETPFESSGYSHEEIIIFNPSKLAIVNNDLIIISKNITELINMNNRYKILNFEAIIGGNNKFIDKNEGFDKIDKQTLKDIKKFGQKLRKSVLNYMTLEDYDDFSKLMQDRLAKNECLFNLH